MFCTGEVHGGFGVFSMFPQQLLQNARPHKISNVEGVLAVEEGDSYLEYYKRVGMHYSNNRTIEIDVLNCIPLPSFSSQQLPHSKVKPNANDCGSTDIVVHRKNMCICMTIKSYT